MSELPIYEAERLGVLRTNKFLKKKQELGNNLLNLSDFLEQMDIDYTQPIRPYRRLYEITDWLGNVRVVISDKKHVLSYNPLRYVADVRVVNDYYSFGMNISERSYRKLRYKYEYNCQETLGEQNEDIYSYAYREYDSRVGRFLSVDPLWKKYAWNSNYAFAENRVIDGIDLEGKEYFYSADGTFLGSIGNDPKVRIVKEKNIKLVKYMIYKAERIWDDKDKIIFSNIANQYSDFVGMNVDELRIRAFLGTIMECEGGRYDVRYGGSKFTGNEHPGFVEININGSKKRFSAAGAYQIIKGTYELYKKKYNIKDFSKESQDKIALKIIEELNAKKDIIEGNLNEAINKLKGQWASFPGGEQQTKTTEDFVKTYKEQIAKELKNESKVATPRGKLFENNLNILIILILLFLFQCNYNNENNLKLKNKNEEERFKVEDRKKTNLKITKYVKDVKDNIRKAIYIIEDNIHSLNIEIEYLKEKIDTPYYSKKNLFVVNQKIYICDKKEKKVFYIKVKDNKAKIKQKRDKYLKVWYDIIYEVSIYLGENGKKLFEIYGGGLNSPCCGECAEEFWLVFNEKGEILCYQINTTDQKSKKRISEISGSWEKVEKYKKINKIEDETRNVIKLYEIF